MNTNKVNYVAIHPNGDVCAFWLNAPVSKTVTPELAKDTMANLFEQGYSVVIFDWENCLALRNEVLVCDNRRGDAARYYALVVDVESAFENVFTPEMPLSVMLKVTRKEAGLIITESANTAAPF